MGKEDMIRQILKGIECDYYRASPVDLERELSRERGRLNEITFGEIEELYYTGHPGSSALQVWGE